jgi:hypothetical protein
MNQLFSNPIDYIDQSFSRFRLIVWTVDCDLHYRKFSTAFECPAHFLSDCQASARSSAMVNTTIGVSNY